MHTLNTIIFILFEDTRGEKKKATKSQKLEWYKQGSKGMEPFKKHIVGALLDTGAWPVEGSGGWEETF